MVDALKIKQSDINFACSFKVGPDRASRGVVRLNWTAGGAVGKATCTLNRVSPNVFGSAVTQGPAPPQNQN